MENYHCKGDFGHPTVNLSCETHCLEFSGVSIPENIHDVYKPVVKWLDQYFAFLEQLSPTDRPKEILCKFEYTSINSGTTVMVIGLMDRLDKFLKTLNIKPVISWGYDEADYGMLNLGKELEQYSQIQIEFIPYVDSY